MRWTCPVTPLNAGKGAPLISPQGSRPPGFESLWTAALARPDWSEPALRQGKLLPSLLGVLGTFDLPNVARACRRVLPRSSWRRRSGEQQLARENLAHERQQVPRWPDPKIRRIRSAVAHSNRSQTSSSRAPESARRTIRSQLPSSHPRPRFARPQPKTSRPPMLQPTSPSRRTQSESVGQ